MITIDPRVFAWNEDEDVSNEMFAVTGDINGTAEPEVINSLTRAIDRLMRVGDDGVEYPDRETPGLAEVYTPNYASKPERTANGIEVYLDCKGAIEPPMEQTLRRVLREELARLDLDLVVNPVIDGE